MTLKKFYATSIEAARGKAQEALGQAYTVVETKEAINDEPAWIHVLHDESKVPSTNGARTYSRRDLFPKALTKLRKRYPIVYSYLTLQIRLIILPVYRRASRK